MISGLQTEHLAFLVGFGVVVAQQVQHAVDSEQDDSCSNEAWPPSTAAPPDTVRCRRAAPDPAELSGLLPGTVRPSGSSSRTRGWGRSIHCTCMSAIVSRSTHSTDSSAAGLTSRAAIANRAASRIS